MVYLNSDAIFSLFTKDALLITLGKPLIFVEFFLEIGRAIKMTMTKCLVATGDVKFAVIISLIGC